MVTAAYNTLDITHWDLSFVLKKLEEQLILEEYRRLIISVERELINYTAVTDYLETTKIENSARIKDILEKAERVIELHNESFGELEAGMHEQGKSHSFNLPNGGFLNIGSAIEVIIIEGKKIQVIPQTKESLDEFFAQNKFALYSSQEFAERCSLLANRITAFYSKEDLILLAKGAISAHTVRHSNIPSQNKTSILMDIEEKYLTTLYLKTKGNPEAGFDSELLGKLVGIDADDISTTVYQLSEEQYIKKQEDKLSITGRGIKLVKELLKNYNITTIKFSHARYVPPASKRVFGFLYVYQLTLPDKTTEIKSISVSVSEWVARQWSLSFQMEHHDERLLLIYGRDKLMEKLLTGSLSEHEEMDIMTTDLPNLPLYTHKDGLAIEDAEFIFYEKIATPASSIPDHQVPDLIVKMRGAINILFKKKHKGELLSLPQQENIVDFYKDATSKDEFNARVISLGATVGEMNIDLLRTLTGITDPEVRSIQLLKKYLETLQPGMGTILKPLQNLATVRNGYPAHKDKPETLKSYAELGIDYPVINYSQSWKKILLEYLTALQKLKEAIESHFTTTAKVTP